MARTFNDLSDAELGRVLRRRYDALCDAHDAGFGEEHPSDRWAADSTTIKEYREAAASGGIAGTVAGQDDEQPKKSASGNSGNGGAEPAMDGQFFRGTDGVPRFTFGNGRTVTGDAAIVARTQASDPARVRRMAAAVPGYNRIR
jgi:hypothetical protein